MDEATRDAERRAALGDEAGEVDQLLARLRAGELTREQLELATLLGHSASGAAIGRAVSRLSNEAFATELQGWGKAVCVRVAYELARQPQELSASARRCLELTANWLALPDADMADMLAEASHECAEQPEASHGDYLAASAATSASSPLEAQGFWLNRLFERLDDQAASDWRSVLATSVAEWALTQGRELRIPERPVTPTAFERLQELPDPYSLVLSTRQKQLIEVLHDWGETTEERFLELWKLDRQQADRELTPLLEREVICAGGPDATVLSLHPTFQVRLNAQLNELTLLPRFPRSEVVGYTFY